MDNLVHLLGEKSRNDMVRRFAVVARNKYSKKDLVVFKQHTSASSILPTDMLALTPDGDDWQVKNQSKPDVW